MNSPIIIRNIITLAVLSLLESIHFLVLTVLVVNYWRPLKYDPAVWNKYFPFLQSAIRPNHDFFFYHWWLVSAIAIQAVLVWYFRRSLQDHQLLRRLRAFMLNEAIFLFLLLFCVFKIILWGSPSWAWCLFYVVLVLSWVMRIFWPEFCKCGTFIYSFLQRFPYPKLLDGMLIVFLVLLIYPTDIKACLARMFTGDYFYQMDGFIMSAAWAFWSGCVMNIDVICMYGIGITASLSGLAKLMGALNYQNMLLVFIYIAVAYFISCYLFLRWWLNSFLLASIGIFLAIKFQMFHWGVAPFYWNFPNATVARYVFDIYFLALILAHIRSRSVWALRGACLCSGISLAYMMDTGTYQVMAFYAYLLILFFERVYIEKSALKGQIPLLGYVVGPVIIALSILRIIGGSTVFSRVYWHNAFEHVQIFLNGMGSLPIYQNISEGDFFAFFMGLFIPLVYLFSALYLASGYFLKQTRRENLFVVVLSVYGLGLYHYFVNRSAPFSYHAVDIPFVFVLMFWARKILSKAAPKLRHGILMGMFLASLGALLTNPLFTYYPNVFNLARPDWIPYKQFYSQEFHFEKEAQLIDSLTSPQEAVGLISSFDVEILMEAKRKPFFYYFPMLHSHFMNEDIFEVPYVNTQARMAKTLGQMEQAKPKYVFVEAKLFRGLLSRQYYEHFVSLRILMDYLHEHYEEYAQGRYLLALRRKGPL